MARCRYKLLYTFRAHLSDDNSYNCVYQKQDERGNSSDLSQGLRFQPPGADVKIFQKASQFLI